MCRVQLSFFAPKEKQAAARNLRNNWSKRKGSVYPLMRAV